MGKQTETYCLPKTLLMFKPVFDCVDRQGRGEEKKGHPVRDSGNTLSFWGTSASLPRSFKHAVVELLSNSIISHWEGNICNGGYCAIKLSFCSNYRWGKTCIWRTVYCCKPVFFTTMKQEGCVNWTPQSGKSNEVFPEPHSLCSLYSFIV